MKATEFKKKTGKVPKKDKLIEQYGIERGMEKWTEYQNNINNRQQIYLDKFPNKNDGLIMQALSKGVGYHKRFEITFDDYYYYAKICRLLTKLTTLLYNNVIDPSGELLGRTYANNGFALDHKFSIYGGFYYRISPYNIAACNNLQVITKKQNESKGQFCIISKEELLSYPTILDSPLISSDVKKEIQRVYY